MVHDGHVVLPEELAVGLVDDVRERLVLVLLDHVARLLQRHVLRDHLAMALVVLERV